MKKLYLIPAIVVGLLMPCMVLAYSYTPNSGTVTVGDSVNIVVSGCTTGDLFQAYSPLGNVLGAVNCTGGGAIFPSYTAVAGDVGNGDFYLVYTATGCPFPGCTPVGVDMGFSVTSVPPPPVGVPGMPSFASSDIALIPSSLSTMTSMYWPALIAILGIIVVIKFTPKVIKAFTK